MPGIVLEREQLAGPPATRRVAQPPDATVGQRAFCSAVEMTG
jgi:hypothetical protein